MAQDFKFLDAFQLFCSLVLYSFTLFTFVAYAASTFCSGLVFLLS